MFLRQLTTASAFLSLAIAVLVLPLSASRPLARQSNSSQTTQPAHGPTSPDPKFAQFFYDVVSIKPLREDASQRESWRGLKETSDGLLAHSSALGLIQAAFHHARPEVNKPSGWVVDDDYDIEAKMDPEIAAAFQELGATDQKLAREHMLQIILRDRFNLAFHTEQREVSGFDLVIAKNGPKLKESTSGDRGMQVRRSNGAQEWDAQGFKIEYMLGQLFYEAGGMVVDKTGLTGSYDFTLRFVSERQTATPDASTLDAAPTLNTALQEQLRLKLVPSKVARDFITIDHIDRPSSN